MKVIGIDVGGTEVKGSVVNEDGDILFEAKVPTDISKGRDGILESIHIVIGYLMKKDSAILGIGIGTAGRVNVHSGEIVFATANLPSWQGTNVKAEIESRYSLPCVVENDANAALIGELWKSQRKPQSAVMITLGTGVGGANAINGEVLNGYHHQSGEWGHVVLVPNGKLCNCGKKGCIEQYLSGTALVQAVLTETELSFRHGSEIFEEFSKGNQQVKQVIDRYLDYLAITMYNISVSIDPEMIFIGGGVIDSKRHWWTSFRGKLKEYCVNTSVHPASLGNKAGMLGAAKLIFQVIEKRGEPIEK
ncbi:ROK family protein [Rossellomorea yichunensis]|jgi:glucokinase|uniref:ROK family protein n=1 Tax=Rossellomorea yichunensis TaxID=3077331 RepID=UPI0028E06397|nr:ROK family protein [Rossellomorea sp. YC4-1]MDT9026914.1 ROK family protein [Rossellomorea sp. YC4-1]